MNREDIIRMAQEIAAQYSKAERFQTWTHDYMMQRLMELVEAEREACAKLCDDLDKMRGYSYADKCAAAIRARGQ
jgi:uncharacterized protein YutE (UPF0331/DUF86 family)